MKTTLVQSNVFDGCRIFQFFVDGGQRIFGIVKALKNSLGPNSKHPNFFRLCHSKVIIPKTNRLWIRCGEVVRGLRRLEKERKSRGWQKQVFKSWIQDQIAFGHTKKYANLLEKREVCAWHWHHCSTSYLKDSLPGWFVVDQCRGVPGSQTKMMSRDLPKWSKSIPCCCRDVYWTREGSSWISSTLLDPLFCFHFGASELLSGWHGSPRPCMCVLGPNIVNVLMAAGHEFRSPFWTAGRSGANRWPLASLQWMVQAGLSIWLNLLRKWSRGIRRAQELRIWSEQFAYVWSMIQSYRNRRKIISAHLVKHVPTRFAPCMNVQSYVKPQAYIYLTELVVDLKFSSWQRNIFPKDHVIEYWIWKLWHTLRDA